MFTKIAPGRHSHVNQDRICRFGSHPTKIDFSPACGILMRIKIKYLAPDMTSTKIILDPDVRTDLRPRSSRRGQTAEESWKENQDSSIHGLTLTGIRVLLFLEGQAAKKETEMTTTIETTKTEEAIAEITANIQEGEDCGQIVAHDETTIRIRFNTVMEAAFWISNYAEAHAVTFESTPASFADKVEVTLSVAAYMEAAGF
jgi:hypothetical protein